MATNKPQDNTFSLDSFKVLLSKSYLNILKSDNDLDRVQEYLTDESTLNDECMSVGKMIELHRAITHRQRTNVQLLTQLFSISNKNEQIKLLLAELTKIKEINDEKNAVPELTPEAKAIIMGLRNYMLEEYNKERGLPAPHEDMPYNEDDVIDIDLGYSQDEDEE